MCSVLLIRSSCSSMLGLCAISGSSGYTASERFNCPQPSWAATSFLYFYDCGIGSTRSFSDFSWAFMPRAWPKLSWECCWLILSWGPWLFCTLLVLPSSSKFHLCYDMVSGLKGRVWTFCRCSYTSEYFLLPSSEKGQAELPIVLPPIAMIWGPPLP